ncbi:uncharacterized protein LOC121760495 [Salvia splendens]|uniref:uncharacterized protein LOC121760495 n=1 Tax=Salvia splendens TaxID=180675 RepID=UPI001C258286|nr:uncharacterized protein LOC121760495 [Salvia splendens]
MITFPEAPRVDANNFELRIPLIQRVEQHPFAVAAFLDKYYPPDTILKLKSEIFKFIKGHDEPLYEAVAHLKGLFRKCPNHGFTEDHQIGILYNSFNEQICAMLDSGANGGFLLKSGPEAMAVIEEFGINNRGWSKERHSSRRAAAIKEAEDNSFAKELAELRVRVDQMDTSRREDPVPPAFVIGVTKPDTSPAPTEDVNYVQQGGGFNVSKGGVVETVKKEEKYDQGIMKIWEVQVQDRKTNDTKIGVVEARLNNLEAEINTIDTAVTNIKNQMDQVQQKIAEEKAKAAARVADINKKWVAKKKMGDVSNSGANSGVCPTPSGLLHTPQRAAAEQAEAPAKDGLMRHNGIEIPRYTKLLRVAVLKKKKLTKADLKLHHHCSEIIQREKALKQRDPGQFIIRCSIGQGMVDKALCDLGASINIMPPKYYEKLNIGPLKTSDVILRLADNSAIKMVGMIEDVLVKVDDFIFTADFIVLDMKVDKNVPLILGTDFLATSKALIDVGRGEITISDNVQIHLQDKEHNA